MRNIYYPKTDDAIKKFLAALGIPETVEKADGHYIDISATAAEAYAGLKHTAKAWEALKKTPCPEVHLETIGRIRDRVIADLAKRGERYTEEKRDTAFAVLCKEAGLDTESLTREINTLKATGNKTGFYPETETAVGSFIEAIGEKVSDCIKKDNYVSTGWGAAEAFAGLVNLELAQAGIHIKKEAIARIKARLDIWKPRDCPDWDSAFTALGAAAKATAEKLNPKLKTRSGASESGALGGPL